MNRDQKAAAIAEIAAHIDESQAVFAVDYRGISVPQVAELRSKLREADASFKVVKNSLTERAADQVGAETLKALLEGPTALTFVRGDIATAAKAIADYGRATQLLPFKGGLMDGAALDPEQIRSLSRLPSREVLYSQLVGVVASPVSGLVRSLSALIGGLASALGQVREKKESGEIPAGTSSVATEEPQAEEPAAEAAEVEASSEEAASEDAPSETAAERPAEETPAQEPAAPEEPPAENETPAEAPLTEDVAVAEVPVAEEAPEEEAESETEPAQDDNQADASADDQATKTADANPKED
jgi:large subunit ribosomal protein L10